MTLTFTILIFIILNIITSDIGFSLAKLEMYHNLKRVIKSGTKELPFDVYSSLCYYLSPIPSDRMVKTLNLLPISYLFNIHIKSLIKDMTYQNKNIINIFERAKELEKLSPEELGKMKLNIKSLKES